ncbi:hypothetical protein [Allorhizocola rhizosphaerae]|uniref:hypothetical protein n=1 Tax=Allorhizocola rhizosphaerae TaxID=1872709 RepID=UPI000E3CE807|nr:hypothetical protein [Allorhizocola rhizosphaerae]
MHPRDPVSPPSPAHVRLEQIRRRLLVAVDELRTLLINGDDLHRPADTALAEPLAGITKLAEDYCDARGQAEAQPGDVTSGLPRRRYVNPGDTILVVLPDTEHCRRAHLAGRRTRVHVTAVDAELDLTVGPGQLRLGHEDAGIHRDPDSDRLYILTPEGGHG